MKEEAKWRWILPGSGIKRHLGLAVLGILIALIGALILAGTRVVHWCEEGYALLDRVLEEVAGVPSRTVSLRLGLGIGCLLLGLGIGWWSLRRAWQRIVHILNPRSTGRVWEVMARQALLAHGKHIVVLGGGTGLSTLLRGLKRYTANLVAIVTVTDDGGSSGRLRRELGLLPPGDIRNCLIALADAEPTMTALFQYRFEGGATSLAGHSFGNLLIAAMTHLTGDFESAVREISKVLAIRGRVLPSTLTHVNLRAEMEDGSCIEGETAIVQHPARIRRLYLNPPTAAPLEEAVQAISQAEIVVIGPGSLFTSVLPNLLVEGIAEALHRTQAVRIYICNVMTQPGETNGFTASDHVRTLEAHVGKRIFDYVLVNTAVPSAPLLEKYRQSGQELVEPDLDRIRALGYRPIPGAFISESDVVRHDPLRLAEAISKLAK